MNEPSQSKLVLHLLHERHLGLTPALGGAFFEAASVALSRHHVPPVKLEIVCDGTMSTQLVDFQMPDIRVSRAWANDIDTTENGAYCVCLAAVEVEERLAAIRRADTLTGADWYVAPIGTEPDDLEDCFRLEVSGLDTGDRAAIAARLRQKVDQTRKGASNLPAIASVVGFKERAVAIQKVSDSK